MIFNITYRDKIVDREINKVLGKPFSFMQRISMRGIGTKKMILTELSPKFLEMMPDNYDQRYAYLELRPNGLLVGFQSNLKTFAWTIPYHFLKIYNNSGTLSIYDNMHYMKMKVPFNGTLDKKFLRKVLEAKAAHTQSFN